MIFGIVAAFLWAKKNELGQIMYVEFRLKIFKSRMSVNSSDNWEK